MTPKRIQELREILANATPWPWQHAPHHASNGEIKADLVVAGTLKTGFADITQDVARAKDAKFIAAARTALPEALDKIERLQDVNEELKRNVEIVSANFDKDCWRAMGKLLEMTGYDFTDEGVTADEAFEHLAEDFKQSKRDFDQIKAELARVKAAKDEAVSLVQTWERFHNLNVTRIPIKDYESAHQQRRAFLARVEGK